MDLVCRHARGSTRAMQSGANSGDDTPTRAVSPDDDVVAAARVTPDDELKASLLGGRGG